MLDLEDYAFVVWGFGLRGKQVVSDLVHYKPWLSLRAILDNDPKKQGAFYDDVPIVPADAYEWDDKTFCIVSVDKDAEIFQYLRQKGYREGWHYQSYRTFMSRWIQAIGARLVSRTSELHAVFIRRGVTMKKALRACHAFFEHITKNDSREKSIGVSNILLAKLWDDRETERAALVRYILRYGSAAQMINAWRARYSARIRPLVAFLKQHPQLFPARRQVKTIGLYYMRYRNGGVEKVLSCLMPLFLREGYRVVLFTDEDDAAYCDMEYDFPAGAERVILQCSFMDRQAERFFELEEKARTYAVDVMCYHGRLLETEFFYEMVLLQLVGISVLGELHQHLFCSIKALTPNWLAAMHQINSLVVLSKTERLFWAGLGVKSVAYIPNPVIPTHQTSDYSRRTALKHILWLGRVEQKFKQVYDIVPIIEAVATRIPDVILDIVGTADDIEVMQELQKRIRARRLEKRIIFHGYHKDVMPFYDRADVMLMTSSFEGFPMAIVESKAAGLPLVLYDLPYLELLRDGKGYLAVPMRDTKAAADALVRILQNRRLRDRMSQDARASLRRFAAFDIAGAWRRMFEDISERKISHPPVKQEVSQMLRLLLEALWEKQGEEM